MGAMTITPILLHAHQPSVLDLADPALRPLDGPGDVALAFELMQLLRPHLVDVTDLATRVAAMRPQGYHLLGAFDAGTLVALAGYRLQENLVYGRFLYVDDLVTAPAQRGSRWGARLLQALQRLASAEGCARLVLDTGVTNLQAQRFYVREGLVHGAQRYQTSLDGLRR